MKAILTTIFLITLLQSVTTQAQSPVFSWARQGKGSGTDSGYDIAVGNSTGSVYTTGSFSGMADFDKNLGGWYLTSAGNSDIFISKSDASGNMLWVKRIGGQNNDLGIHICVDNLENVYVSGRFNGTVDFDPGPGVFNLTSSSNASFILKLSGAGNFVFAYSYGLLGGGILISEIVTDASNNLYASGQLNGTFDFDPGAGVANFSAYQVGFLLKLSSAGIYVFAKIINSNGYPDYNSIVAMSLDPSGNIVVTGNLNGSADFDMGAGVVTLTSSGLAASGFANDYFIAKYTSTGNYVWAGLTGGTASTIIWVYGCATDSWGNIYVHSRSFGGPVDFNIKSGVNSIVTLNGSEWIQKIKPNGDFVWAKTINANIDIESIKTNTADGLYLAGQYNSTQDFDPGPGVFNMTANTSISVGIDDIYILKLDSAFNFQWAKGFGGAYSDNLGDIFITPANNVLSTGGFTGSGDFDPNAGILNLVGKGANDIFIQKLNSSGSLTWAYGVGSEVSIELAAISPKCNSYFCTTGSLTASPSLNFVHQGGADIFMSTASASGSMSISNIMGGPGTDAGTGIYMDGANNVYLTGYFEQTAKFYTLFTTSAINLTSAGDKDIVVLKFNSSNVLVWAKRIGSTNHDQPYAITADNLGNLYVTGFFQGTVDFDPGTGVSNLTSSGGMDAFVLKLDTAGNFIWARNIGGANSDMGYDVAADASGNVLVTGTFNGTADFDPSAAVSNMTSAGNIDGFVLKLNSSGNFVWSIQIGSTQNEIAKSIEADGSGNVYVAGTFGGTTDFDPGAGTFTINPPNNSGEVFIQKLNAAGNFVFAKSMGGPGTENISGLLLDAGGNIYTTGIFQGTADLNPRSAVTTNFTSNGLYDTFINCYNSTLDTSWTKTFGGAGNDLPVGISMDAARSIYIGGNFADVVDFNPDAGVSNLTAPGESDIFAMKLTQLSPLPVELVAFSADARNNNEVLCKWATVSESGNVFFTVEKSRDAIHFEMAGIINGAGNSMSITNYSFTDKNPFTGISYYRLKQTDINGAYTYSQSVAVQMNKASAIKVYPLVTTGEVSVTLEEKSVKTAVTIMNAEGKIFYDFQVGNSSGEHKFDLTALANGLYYFTITTDESRQSFKVIKQ